MYRLKLLCVFCVVVIQIVSARQTVADAAADQTQPARQDLHFMNLSDGSFLSIRAPIDSPDNARTTRAWLVRHQKGATNPKYPTHWRVEVGTVDYAPRGKPCYALVKEAGDRIVVYMTWSNSYFDVDLASGRMRAKGDGDDLLRGFADVVPLKVTFVPPASGRMMTAREVEDFDRRERELDKATRDQTTPKSGGK